MIYLDNSATTMVDDRVLETFNKVCKNYPGNSNSLHSLGIKSKELEEYATEKISNLLGVKPSEIIYTSGASESNNTVLKGVASKYKNRGNHIITTPLEHSSVLETCKYLESKGFIIDYVKIKDNGLIDIEDLERLLTDNTILVSVAYVDSELGIRQDIDTISKIVKKHPKCYFHVDATQAIGKIKVDPTSIDFISMSAHKIFGLKGIGLLIKKDNIKQVACEEEIQQYVDKKILIDEKDIIKYLILEILEYIFEIQGKKMEQEDIYFLINKDEDIYLENIKTLSEKFKTTNIITEELSKFQKIVENIFEEETTIYLSNNKRKSLRRAKYIVNFDYGIGEIEKYNINRTAILINIEQKVKIESMAFEGISINNVNIQIPDELIEHFGRMMEKINKNILYMSLVNQKQELARIKDRIKEDNIHILNLIGDKGIISQEEFKRIP